MQYRRTRTDVILRLDDGASIPVDESNRDYIQYLNDVAGGAVVDDADPEPVVYAGSSRVDGNLRTTDATPTQLYRATLAQRTGYRASLTLIAVDAGNGACRTIEARITAKRLTNGALLVGQPVVVAAQQDSGTAAWGIGASVSGNDFVVTVTGAAGRNIDWMLSGDVVSFTPGGR